VGIDFYNGSAYRLDIDNVQVTLQPQQYPLTEERLGAGGSDGASRAVPASAPQ
jgi:hypothetical protein